MLGNGDYTNYEKWMRAMGTSRIIEEQRGGLSNSSTGNLVVTGGEWANSVGMTADGPWAITAANITGPILHTDATLKASVAAERSRILAAIKELKPPHRPKAHGDWARSWKEAGALEMYERVIAAIGGE